MIKLYKLISGEEIIATQVQDGTDFIQIKEAVTLVYHEVSPGQMSVGFAPFMNYADGPVRLYTNSLACCADVKDQLKQEYIRMHSRIVVAPASALNLQS